MDVRFGPQRGLSAKECDAFELWCWRRLLRIPWTENRSNQLILKEINPEYSLERLMLMVNLQYFSHLMWRTDSLEKILMLGKPEAGGDGDGRGWDGWMALPTWWTNLSKIREMVKDRKAWCSAVCGVTKIWTQLSNWTTKGGNHLAFSQVFPLNQDFMPEREVFKEKSQVFYFYHSKSVVMTVELKTLGTGKSSFATTMPHKHPTLGVLLLGLE